VLEALDVLDPDTLEPVPADGETLGEVMFRGNVVMKGYLKNPAATAKAFAGGWFHSGDLGVKDPDGYVQLKDRSKDIIISGGENISSIEVEDALYKHPAVQAAAVVARPDEKWGETPCAFVELKPSEMVSPKSSSPGAAGTSPPTRSRARWCSPNCRKPPRARSRSSGCARWRGDCEPPHLARGCAPKTRKPLPVARDSGLPLEIEMSKRANAPSGWRPPSALRSRP
jgi:hypothetical protein